MRSTQARRRTLGAAALLATVAVLLSQLRPLPQDQGVLLSVAGQPVDVAGRMMDRWQAMVRRCDSVTVLASGSPRWQAVQRQLAAYSPPASLSATPVQVLSWGQGDDQWLLAEVWWPAANKPPADSATNPATESATDPATDPVIDPAIVPLRQIDGALQVQAAGVWSGDTGPWWPPVFIRRQLAERMPAMPATLRQCLDPQLPRFAR